MLWDIVLVGCLLSFSVEASAVWIFLLLYLTWQFYFFLTPELFFLISRYVFYCYKMFFEHQLLLCANKLSSFLTVSIFLHTKLYKLTSLLSCNSFFFFSWKMCYVGGIYSFKMKRWKVIESFMLSEVLQYLHKTV